VCKTNPPFSTKSSPSTSPTIYQMPSLREHLLPPPPRRDHGRQSTFWSIAFWVNLILVLSFAIPFSYSHIKPRSRSSIFFSQSSISDLSDFFSSLRLGFLSALIFTILHLLYTCIFPIFYVKFANYFGFIATISIVICSFVFAPEALTEPISWLFAVISIIGSILWFNYSRSRITYTSTLLRETSMILLANPLLFALQILQLILSAIFMLVLLGPVYLIINYAPENLWLIPWLILSYYWVINTLYYALFLAGAGTAACHFYDGNGDAGINVVRAFGPLFGIASLCGFALGLIQSLRLLLKISSESSRRRNEDDDDDRNGLGWFAVIAEFLLNILESLVEFVSHYSLLFCGIHGCSLKEGFRRLRGQSFESILKRMNDQSILNAALNIHNALFVGIAVMAVLIIVSINGKEDVVALAAVVVFGLASVWMVKVPFVTVSETLQLCYLEEPERMKGMSEDLWAQSRRFTA
jgi:hypothetical protein